MSTRKPIAGTPFVLSYKRDGHLVQVPGQVVNGAAPSGMVSVTFEDAPQVHYLRWNVRYLPNGSSTVQWNTRPERRTDA